MPLTRILYLLLTVIVAACLSIATGRKIDPDLLTGELPKRVYKATVIHVSDGDTLSVKPFNDRKTRKLRLQGIDAPELGQPFAREATERLRTLTYLKALTIEEIEQDRYGRQVAYVYLPDGTMVQEQLLYDGLAWMYRRYSSSIRFFAAERSARNSGIGLWQQQNPLAPWDFRLMKRKKSPKHGR